MKERLRIGYVGMGGRGRGQMGLSLDMDDIDVVAVCDVYEDRVRDSLDIIRTKRPELQAEGYSDYRKASTQPSRSAARPASRNAGGWCGPTRRPACPA